MRLGEGFYEALEGMSVAVSRGQAIDVDAELDHRGVMDPRQRTLAWDVCQAAAQALAVREGRAPTSSYVSHDHRLRRHIASYLDAGSRDALAMTRKADGFLQRAITGGSVRRAAVLMPIPRRATRADEEDTLVGTAA